VLSSRRRRRHSTPQEAGILGLVPEGPNRLALETIAREAGLALQLVDAEGLERECRRWTGTPAIVLYDVGAAASTWRERIRSLASCSPRPYIILLSTTVDPNLWDELQRVGGADILRAPIDRERLLEAIAKGRQFRSAQEHLLGDGFPATR
jgi:DNA-binding NarL/FixJ family response regulator